jgi:hypothetical protein
MNPINLYSAPLMIVFVLVVAGIIIVRRGLTVGGVLVFAVLAIGLVVTWLLVRPRQTPHAELADIRSQIGAGKPVLLEFQSPY